MISITPESHKLFMAFAEDACNWNNEPLLDISKEQRGNLTQLKTAGLLETFKSDGVAWVSFTDSGKKYAATNGISIEA